MHGHLQCFFKTESQNCLQMQVKHIFLLQFPHTSQWPVVNASRKSSAVSVRADLSAAAEQRTGATTSPTTRAMPVTPTTQAPSPAMESTSPSQSLTGPVMQVEFFFAAELIFWVILLIQLFIQCHVMFVRQMTTKFLQVTDGSGRLGNNLAFMLRSSESVKLQRCF